MSAAGFIYAIVFLPVWWSCQGYFTYLFLFRERENIKGEDAYLDFPPSLNKKFTIIVPVFNEINLIKKKIENLRELAYKNYEVYFVDASTDNTAEIISENISALNNFRLIKSSQKGRSFQINTALSLATGDFIICTDVDAMMERGALERILEEFRDERVGVIGCRVVPDTNYKIDILFWRFQNNMRFMESLYGHSPVASGACYTFRKDLVDKIPDDVWAEDIYIPFLANFKRYKSVYSKNIMVKEVRAPRNLKDFVKSKVRKGGDNIKELFRFLPSIHRARFKWLVVYITRFMQIVLLPVILPIWIILLFFQPSLFIPLSSIALMFLSAVLQYFIFKNVFKKTRLPNIMETGIVFLTTYFILLFSLIGFPFSRGKINYLRVGE